MKLTFIYFFLMALLGLAIYYGLALNKFNHETPGLTFLQTNKNYFKDKVFALIVNILIILAFTIILAADPTGWLMDFMTGGVLQGTDIPSKFYVFSLLIGLGGQAMLSLILGKLNVNNEIKPQ
jgi:hypothetical protein